jgi:hypothetical protein
MFSPWVTRLVAVFIVTGSLFAAPLAHADRQAAVLLFEGGRGTDEVRSMVAQYLNTLVTVIPISDVEDAADRANVRLDTPEGIQQVSRELLLDFLIKGTVTGRGSSMELTLTAVDKNGEELTADSVSGTLSGRKGKPKVEELTENVYRATVEALEDQARRMTDQEEEGKAPDESHEGRFAIKDRLREQEERVNQRTPYDQPILAAYAVLGARNRSAEVAMKAGGLRRVYDAGFFPEIAFRFVSRPYGISSSALRGLHFDGEAAISLGLGSQDDNKRQFDSMTFRFNIDAGYAFRLGIVELGAKAGFGYDNFDIDENLVIPSSTYTYIRPGVFGRIDIIDYWLHAHLDAGARIGLGAGEIADIFGKQASVFGFDIGAGVGGAIPDIGIAYDLRLQYLNYGVSFSGTAPIAAESAKDMSDSGVSIMLCVGYQVWSGFQ